MNIEQFVKESLVQIARGIEKAQDDLSDSDAIVHPKLKYFNNGESVTPDVSLGLATDGGGGFVSVVMFDVAVTVEEDDDRKNEARLKIFSHTRTSKGRTSELSRIRFHIPLKLPRPAD